MGSLFEHSNWYFDVEGEIRFILFGAEDIEKFQSSENSELSKQKENNQSYFGVTVEEYFESINNAEMSFAQKLINLVIRIGNKESAISLDTDKMWDTYTTQIQRKFYRYMSRSDLWDYVVKYTSDFAKNENHTQLELIAIQQKEFESHIRIYMTTLSTIDLCMVNDILPWNSVHHALQVKNDTNLRKIKYEIKKLRAISYEVMNNSLTWKLAEISRTSPHLLPSMMGEVLNAAKSKGIAANCRGRVTAGLKSRVTIHSDRTLGTSATTAIMDETICPVDAASDIFMDELPDLSQHSNLHVVSTSVLEPHVMSDKVAERVSTRSMNRRDISLNVDNITTSVANATLIQDFDLSLKAAAVAVASPYKRQKCKRAASNNNNKPPATTCTENSDDGEVSSGNGFGANNNEWNCTLRSLASNLVYEYHIYNDSCQLEHFQSEMCNVQSEAKFIFNEKTMQRFLTHRLLRVSLIHGDLFEDLQVNVCGVLQKEIDDNVMKLKDAIVNQTNVDPGNTANRPDTTILDNKRQSLCVYLQYGTSKHKQDLRRILARITHFVKCLQFVEPGAKYNNSRGYIGFEILGKRYGLDEQFMHTDFPSEEFALYLELLLGRTSRGKICKEKRMRKSGGVSVFVNPGPNADYLRLSTGRWLLIPPRSFLVLSGDCEHCGTDNYMLYSGIFKIFFYLDPTHYSRKSDADVRDKVSLLAKYNRVVVKETTQPFKVVWSSCLMPYLCERCNIQAHSSYPYCFKCVLKYYSIQISSRMICKDVDYLSNGSITTSLHSASCNYTATYVGRSAVCSGSLLSMVIKGKFLDMEQYHRYKYSQFHGSTVDAVFISDNICLDNLELRSLLANVQQSAVWSECNLELVFDQIESSGLLRVLKTLRKGDKLILFNPLFLRESRYQVAYNNDIIITELEEQEDASEAKSCPLMNNSSSESQHQCKIAMPLSTGQLNNVGGSDLLIASSQEEDEYRYSEDDIREVAVEYVSSDDSCNDNYRSSTSSSSSYSSHTTADRATFRCDNGSNKKDAVSSQKSDDDNTTVIDLNSLHEIIARITAPHGALGFALRKELSQTINDTVYPPNAL